MTDRSTFSDEELITHSRNGDHQAFGHLVDRYQQRIRTVVLSMLGDVQEADDVAQEVFIRFYKALDQFRGEAQLLTYLTRIAINQSLNALQRRKREPVESLEDGVREGKLQYDQDLGRRQDIRDMIQVAVQQLDAELRPAVTLHFVEGYTIRETSKILQQPEGTISSRLAKALYQLRQFLLPIMNL